MSDDTKPADWREAFVKRWTLEVLRAGMGGTSDDARALARAMFDDARAAPPQAGLDPLTPLTPDARHGLMLAIIALESAVDFVTTSTAGDITAWAGTARSYVARWQKGLDVAREALRLSDAGVPTTNAATSSSQFSSNDSEPPVREPTDGAAAWCPQCGPCVAIDEDGCCASCGADATGEGADRAVAAMAELGRIRRELAHLGERLEDTFRGGYSDQRDVEIFRHGMGTAATCVEAVLRGERNQAPIVRPHPKTSRDAGGEG